LELVRAKLVPQSERLQQLKLEHGLHLSAALQLFEGNIPAFYFILLFI